MFGATHEHQSLRILDVFESNHTVSQRSLANELGIALGLTNLLVKRMVHKGWVRVIQIKPNRASYLITPTGIAEKVRMSREYFESSVQFYCQTRDRMQRRLSMLSIREAGSAPRPQRVVFFGAGEVAEIAFVCLAETELQLVGVVDATRTKPFFGFNVFSPKHLDGLAVGGQPFDRLVVTSFGDADALRCEMRARHVPVEAVFWL